MTFFATFVIVLGAWFVIRSFVAKRHRNVVVLPKPRSRAAFIAHLEVWHSAPREYDHVTYDGLRDRHDKFHERSPVWRDASGTAHRHKDT